MTNHTYLNFDLLITSTGDGYTARILNSPTGQGSCDFVLPFSQAELQAFLRVSGRATRALRLISSPETSPPQLTPKTFGQRLFDAVFDGDVGMGLIRSLDEAERQQKGLRIQLRLDSPELADLPWEFLYASSLDRFLILSNQTVLVRYLELPQGEKPLQVSPPLRILAVISDPSDVAKLNVEAEWIRMSDALLPLQGNGLLTLERLSEATLPALQSRLQQEPPVHILHFIGHGYFEPALPASEKGEQGEQGGSGGLVFEEADGRSRLVDAVDLATTLRDHKTLRLLFLNACEGARGGRVDAFAGTAQKLVQQGIPAVLAMQFEVSDQAAIQLATEFYRATVNGYPADAALAEARKFVSTSGNEREWATPVLFSRSDDNQVLVMPEGDLLPVIDIQPFEPETVVIRGGPFLMGSNTDDPDEAPQHEVTLPDFRMGVFPITNREYAKFIEQNPEHPTPTKPDWFLRKPPAGREEHPVTGVSWRDALAYCQWLSQEDVTGRRYMLPSEAEWEWAASGASTSSATAGTALPELVEGGNEDEPQRYPWGNEWNDDAANVDGDDTTPKSEHPTGASPDGCLDMLGNVQEWTRTIWGSDRKEPGFTYPYSVNDSREDLDADQHGGDLYRVHRGGSYRSDAEDVRCSARGASKPDSAVRWRGFRVMMKIVERE